MASTSRTLRRQPLDKTLVNDDMGALIRKRKFEIQQRSTVTSDSDDQRLRSDNACAAAKKTTKRHRRNQPPDREEALSSTYDAKTRGGLLGSQLLEQYLGLRKGNSAYASDAKVKPNILVNEQESQGRSGRRSSKDTDQADQHLSGEITVEAPTLAMQSTGPAPEYAVPTTPSSFVVSSRFLQDRKLAQEIETLYPAAVLIERDFQLHLQSSPHSTQAEEPELHPAWSMDSEADLILSPSTGLVITTFQKIKQRALPGHKTNSAIREQIVKASPRYEKLIVLVTSSCSLDQVDRIQTIGLCKEDCEALTDFTALCTGIQEKNRVYLVSSRTGVLAKWIVSFMVQYRLDNLNVNLLQEETLWEVFLRRAGLNAFAAQTICAAYKNQGQDDRDDQAGNQRLRAFLKMSVEARLARFEYHFGGRNLLLRVSDMLDACWR